MRRFSDPVLVGLLAFSILLTLTILLVILGVATMRGAGQVSWEFLTQPPKNGLTAGGIFPAIVGTAALVLLMTIVAVPLGVATAVYLHEYTPPEGPHLAWSRFVASKGEPRRFALFRRVASA